MPARSGRSLVSRHPWSPAHHPSRHGPKSHEDTQQADLARGHRAHRVHHHRRRRVDVDGVDLVPPVFGQVGVDEHGRAYPVSRMLPAMSDVTGPMPAATAAAAIKVRNLTKVFRKQTAVDGLTFEVARGRFFGFLGPNGAGKSTTIKMLTGLLRPTAGEVTIEGLPLATDLLGIKRLIGVLPEELPLYERLTGEEYLHFAGRMYGLARDETRGRTDELLQFLSLHEDRGKLIVDYSQGMRKKVALAAALIHSPRVLFLDEPLNGIDPGVRPRRHRSPAPAGREGRDPLLHHPRARRRGAAVRRGGDHRQGADRRPGHAGRDPLRRATARWRTCS